MFASSVVLLAFATLGFAFSDQDANYPYTIAAGSLPSSTTDPWCVAQQNSCREICGGLASPNACDSTALTYNCVCSGPNAVTPNVTMYSQTIPFFTCQQYKINCVMSTDSAVAQHACNAIPCGSLDPVAALANYSSSQAAAAASTTSSSASASSSAASTTGAAGSATGAAGSAGSSATSGAASAVASATSKAGAAAATAGVGLLGAAVAGFVAFMA